jgi:hypothetical protein
MPVARERCAMCGATLAADQRYCVECGQRCGPSRVPFTDGLAQRAQATPSPGSRSQRRRPSVNSTLIAGVGTLLLALGVGVLIGRLGDSSTSKSPAVQVVTVAGGSGAGAAAGTTGTGAEAQTSTAAGSAKTGAAATGAAAAAAAAKAKAAKPAVPPTKVVKVGSKGSGPGYQHGHFTGNFFGG